MKQIRIKHDGEDVVGIVPETWAELKVKHFICLESDFQEVDFIATFMDIPRALVENITGDLSPITKTIQGLFDSKPLNISEAKKKVLEMDGKQIKFPKSLDFTRYGQKSLLKNIIQKESELQKEISTVFAIYAQPLIDGKFDSARIEEVKKLVDEMPILDVYPYVVFFFKKSRELRNHLQTKLQISQGPTSKPSMRF